MSVDAASRSNMVGTTAEVTQRGRIVRNSQCSEFPGCMGRIREDGTGMDFDESPRHTPDYHASIGLVEEEVVLGHHNYETGESMLDGPNEKEGQQV